MFLFSIPHLGTSDRSFQGEAALIFTGADKGFYFLKKLSQTPKR